MIRTICDTFLSGYYRRRNYAYECAEDNGDEPDCWHVNVSRWQALRWSASATWGFAKFEVWMRRRAQQEEA